MIKHGYIEDSENKIQLKQWLQRGCFGPVEFKGRRSAKKIMATIILGTRWSNSYLFFAKDGEHLQDSTTKELCKN